MKPGVTCRKLVSLNKIGPVIEKTQLIQRRQCFQRHLSVHACPCVINIVTLECLKTAALFFDMHIQHHNSAINFKDEGHLTTLVHLAAIFCLFLSHACQ